MGRTPPVPVKAKIQASNKPLRCSHQMHKPPHATLAPTSCTSLTPATPLFPSITQLAPPTSPSILYAPACSPCTRRHSPVHALAPWSACPAPQSARHQHPQTSPRSPISPTNTNSLLHALATSQISTAQHQTHNQSPSQAPHNTAKPRAKPQLLLTHTQLNTHLSTRPTPQSNRAPPATNSPQISTYDHAPNQPKSTPNQPPYPTKPQQNNTTSHGVNLESIGAKITSIRPNQPQGVMSFGWSFAQ